MSDLSGVKRDISSVERALRSLESSFTDDLRRLHNSINNHESRLREQGEDIVALAHDFKGQLDQIERHFTNFQDTLEQVRDVSVHGNELIESGNERIVGGIEVSTSTSREGLEKISSGMAMVEILEARSASLESMTAITRAMDEIGNRFHQAELAVLEKKGVFAKHYEQTLKGFESQLRVIASHIYEIIDKGFSDFDKMRISAFDSEKIRLVLESVQKARLDARRTLVDNEFTQLNLDSLRNIVELRDRLRDLLSDSSLLSSGFESEQDVPVGYIPVAAVRMDGTVRMVASLNATAIDCDWPLEVRPELREHLSAIDEACRSAGVSDGYWSDEEKSSLIEALSDLERAGLLSARNLQLIKEHLAEYPLERITLS